MKLPAPVHSPLATSHSPPATCPLPPATCPSPLPLVRVVDDDTSFLTAVTRMLRASGFAVKTFASAAEFLARPEPELPGASWWICKCPA